MENTSSSVPLSSTRTISMPSTSSARMLHKATAVPTSEGRAAVSAEVEDESIGLAGPHQHGDVSVGALHNNTLFSYSARQYKRNTTSELQVKTHKVMPPTWLLLGKGEGRREWGGRRASQSSLQVSSVLRPQPFTQPAHPQFISDQSIHPHSPSP
ncbi:hypothetical protein E2C01_014802 [Portunus trituberculatus]|uniref:Uncharacterized protein n=1 Tax=Portunus trituberculatus TaxID=210409 RepID=A0A5B7DKY9_PORTR|nr:hypothetical protein [Portunus trituberculatus]